MHIRNALKWRDENMGQGAADELMEEIEATIRLLKRFPFIGSKVLNARSPGALHIYMKAIDRFLYYRVNEARGELEILGVRHTSRGNAPGI